jgi:acetyl-CoA C-acetyltransferase
MRSVFITGIGQTPVREHWELGLRELAAEAALAALNDAGNPPVDALYVGNMLSGTLANQEHLGALIAEHTGLTGIEAVKVEAACGSAAAAFRQALLAVASGYIDNVICLGVEKLTENSASATTAGLATAADADYETAMGLTFVAINALLMQRYMHEYGYQKSDFAVFGINAHENAYHNPNAMFRQRITKAKYELAKSIVDPINLLDSSPIADGAAAVVLSATPPAEHPIVEVAACEISTDTIGIANRENPLHLSAVEKSVHKALQRASSTHRDINFFELHDAFSIMAALSLEAAGFAEKGQAVRMANESFFGLKGNLPICTMGGLKGRGHPVGATGLYQIVEAVSQLRGIAPPPLQLENADTALVQNIGGSGATVITTILKRK